MHYRSTLLFQLIGKFNTIIILDALRILGIHQNIIRKFLVWTVLPKICILQYV